MALSLEDVIRRRVPLALLERLDSFKIKELADLLAPHFGRDSADVAAEFRASRAAIH
jgi:hypothetical protein